MWIAFILIFFILPALLALKREQSTTAITLAMVGVTIATLVALSVNITNALILYIVGVTMGLFGIAYREDSINTDFDNPDDDELDPRESKSGLRRSLYIRLMQHVPIGIWVAFAFSTFNHILSLIVFFPYLVLALVLTKYESQRWASLRRDRANKESLKPNPDYLG